MYKINEGKEKTSKKYKCDFVCVIHFNVTLVSLATGHERIPSRD
jgi:hypothetical protein